MSQAWRIKQKTDETTPSTSINMVFILLMEFKAPADEDSEGVAIAQLMLDPIHVVEPT
jgi:hypothetical protein